MALLQRVKNEPGMFFIPSLGKKIKIVEWKEDDRYDTVVRATGAVTAGAQHIFFRDITNKEKIDANFPSSRRALSNGEEMVLERVGVDVPQSFGNVIINPDDIKKVAYGVHLVMKLDRREICEGPLYKFPSGYGLSGMTNENDTGVVSIGVPSTAAAAKLAREQEVFQDTDVEGIATWYDRTWDTTNMATLSSRVFIRVFLHGLIKSGATKG